MKKTPQSTNGPSTYRMTVLWACVVCILTVAGCRRRPIEITPDIKSPEQTWVRVLLFGNLRECTVASSSGFTVEDAVRHTTAEFRSEEPVVVRSSDGAIAIGEHVFADDVLIRPHEPYVFEIDGASYRGHLRLVATPGKKNLQAINHVPLESYLLGVVGAEMQSYWEPEALKSQSVACRTYCLFTKDRFGSNRLWDMSQTEAHQVYRGVLAETTPVRLAVLETAGEVLVCESADTGRDTIFPTYYSSSCGGHTEPAEHVFGGNPIVSLNGVHCDYCRDVARRSNFYWKPVTMTMSQISEKLMRRYESLAQLERIVDMEVTELGHKSRILRVLLIGQNGKTDWLRGEDFRLSLDPTGRKLKSAIFSIEKKGQIVTFQNGLGFGHGVGMCQCGVQGMARQGKTYEQILQHYFPKSNIVQIRTPDTTL